MIIPIYNIYVNTEVSSIFNKRHELYDYYIGFTFSILQIHYTIRITIYNKKIELKNNDINYCEYNISNIYDNLNDDIHNRISINKIIDHHINLYIRPDDNPSELKNDVNQLLEGLFDD